MIPLVQFSRSARAAPRARIEEKESFHRRAHLPNPIIYMWNQYTRRPGAGRLLSFRLSAF